MKKYQQNQNHQIQFNLIMNKENYHQYKNQKL